MNAGPQALEFFKSNQGRIHKEYDPLDSEDEEEIQKITRNYKTKKQLDQLPNEDIWQLGELSNGEIGYYPVARSQVLLHELIFNLFCKLDLS